MFAEVIVDQPTDPKKNFFTYKIPPFLSKEIIIGQIVEVPWGKKIAYGLVFEIKKTTGVKNLKEISRIFFPLPLLLPYHIKLLKWMSWYYHAPMIDCLKTMLPAIPKGFLDHYISRKDVSERVDHSLPPTGGRTFGGLQEHLIANEEASEQTIVKNIGQAKDSSTANKQTIILVPNINQIPLTIAELKSSKNIIIYHSELKKRERFAVWLQMLQGNFEVVIGSRSAVFAPVKNLGQIVIKSEQDQSYKDERSPYFQTTTVAAKIALITDAKLILESQTPQIETYFSFKNHKIKPSWQLTIPKHQRSKITIVDLIEERKSGNFSFLSDILRNTMIQKLQNSQNILLFLNRKIEAGYLFCPQCNTSEYRLLQPEICPNCQNPMIRFYSTNLKKVKEEMETFLPARIQISLVEADTKIKTVSPITLATSAILYSIIPRKFNLVGVISADNILNLPDFRASERTFQTLWQLSNLLSTDGQMIIQTHNPSHPAIIFAAKKDYLGFWRSEISLRKNFGYPPFSKLAKLAISAKKETTASLKAEELMRRIKSLVVDVEILGPTPSFSKSPNKFTYNLILKSKERRNFESILNLVPVDWTVNIDPKDTL